MVETASCHLPLRNELRRSLDWAEEHASSLAQILTSYENHLNSLRLTLTELDSSNAHAESAKEINGPKARDFSSSITSAVSQSPVSDDPLVNGEACDPSDIVLNVGRQTSPESTQSGGSGAQRLGRYSVHELKVCTALYVDTELSLLSRCKEYVDMGQWDLMVSVCEGRPFLVIMGVVILASTLFVAYEADTDLRVIQEKSEDASADVRPLIDLILCACFSVEVIMKLLAYRIGFFIGPDWKWNLFDGFNAITSVLEIVIQRSGGKSSVAGMLRPVRALKLLRMVRIVKFLRRFREVRLLAAHLINCSSSLVWTVTLIAIVTYLFACIFLQAWVMESKRLDGLPSAIFTQWGSTRSAMLTLFSGPTDGQDWVSIAEPLWELGQQYYWLFLGYVVFFTFVISNIITSLIVETVMSLSGKDDCDVAMEHMKRKKHYVETVTSIFKHIDRTGFVTLDLFKEHLHNTEMLAFAEEMGVEAEDMEHLFETLSKHGKHKVDVETFVVSCIRMRGAAKSIDMMDTLSTLVRLDMKHANFEQRTDETLGAIRKDIYGKLDIILQETQTTRRIDMETQIQLQEFNSRDKSPFTLSL